MKKFKVSLFLLFLILSSAVGCTKASSTADAGKNDGAAVTLNIYDMRASYRGLQEGWFAKELENRLNVKLNFIDPSYGGGEEKTDIIVWHNSAVFEDTHDRWELLELTDGLLAENGKNITKYAEEQMEFVSGLCGGKRTGVIFGIDGTGDGYKDTGRICAVAADSDNAKKAVRFIDWLCTPAASLTEYYGPEGLCWDVDSEGFYYLTELGKQCRQDSDTALPEGWGGTFYDGIYKSSSLYMWELSAVNPDSAHGQGFDCGKWED